MLYLYGKYKEPVKRKAVEIPPTEYYPTIREKVYPSHSSVIATKNLKQPPTLKTPTNDEQIIINSTESYTIIQDVNQSTDPTSNNTSRTSQSSNSTLKNKPGISFTARLNDDWNVTLEEGGD